MLFTPFSVSIANNPNKFYYSQIARLIQTNYRESIKVIDRVVCEALHTMKILLYGEDRWKFGSELIL